MLCNVYTTSGYSDVYLQDDGWVEGCMTLFSEMPCLHSFLLYIFLVQIGLEIELQGKNCAFFNACLP